MRGPAFSLQLLADLLDFAEDTEQVAAENLAAVFGGVAALHQGCRNLGQVGRRIEALGQLPADAIEVRTEADVIDACDFRDVVDVVDEHGERRARDAVGKLALQLVDLSIRSFFAFGLVLVLELLDGLVHFGLDGSSARRDRPAR